MQLSCKLHFKFCDYKKLIDGHIGGIMLQVFLLPREIFPQKNTQDKFWRSFSKTRQVFTKRKCGSARDSGISELKTVHSWHQGDLNFSGGDHGLNSEQYSIGGLDHWVSLRYCSPVYFPQWQQSNKTSVSILPTWHHWPPLCVRRSCDREISEARYCPPVVWGQRSHPRHQHGRRGCPTLDTGRSCWRVYKTRHQ